MTERLCEWSDDPKDFNNLGKPTPEYLELYRVWGQGECGILIMGNVPVDARYPEAKKNAVIDKTQTWNQVEGTLPFSQFFIPYSTSIVLMNHIILISLSTL